MPQRGFKRSRVNNKKKKRTKNKDKTVSGNKNSAKNFRFNHKASKGATYAETTNQSKIKTFYLKYKETTNRFQRELLGLVPESEKFIKDDKTVHVLEKAAEYVKDNDILVSPRLLKNLKTSIKVRAQASELYPMYIDEGRHRYFIDILRYCWSILASRKQPKSKLPVSKNHGNEVAKESNKFASLATEEDEESEDDEIELPDLSSNPVKPIVPKVFTSPPSLDELINGTTRFRVLVMMSSIDEMLARVSTQYKILKQNCSRLNNNNHDLIEEILESAISCNFCIKETQRLEQVLIMEIPWLNTIYRQIVILQYPDLVSQVFNAVVKISPNAGKFQEKHAIQFLGDLLECAFRNISDPKGNREKVKKKFHDTWQIPLETLQHYDEVIYSLVTLGVGFSKQVDQMNTNFIRNKAGIDLKLPGLLEFFPSVGGPEYSIFKTIKLLQGLSNVLSPDRPLKLNRGFFGAQWDEKRKKAKKIPGDMDEFLMGDVFPALSSKCYLGLLTEDIPMMNELLTVIKVIRDYVNNPSQSVSWGLAVGVHCILISVYEVQGDNHVHTLARIMRNCYDKFYNQIDAAESNNVQGVQPPAWRKGIESIGFTRWMVVPLKVSDARFNVTPEEELRAFWNPFIGGSFLLFTVFFENMQNGCNLVDSFSQLRLVLHLYNALRVCNLVSDDAIPFMKWLDDTFRNSKGVWEGDKPKRGELVKRWWITWGASTRYAQRITEEMFASPGNDKNTNAQDIRKTFAPRKEHRKMTAVLPEHISKAFRRVCNNDISNLEDKYHTLDQKKKYKLTFSYQLAVRINDTLDAVDDESQLLGANLVTIGVILNVFIKRLFDHLGFSEIVNSIIINAPAAHKKGRTVTYKQTNKWQQSDDNLTRQTEVYFFVHQILGVLEAHEPSLLSAAPEVGIKSAAFLKEFFNKIKREDYAYF